MPAVTAGAVKGWTIERMDLLQERVAAGVSEAAIAAELEMPERIIALKREALGLKYAHERTDQTKIDGRRAYALKNKANFAAAQEVARTHGHQPTRHADHSARMRAAHVLGSAKSPNHSRQAPAHPASISKAWADEKAKDVLVVPLNLTGAILHKIEGPEAMPVSQATRENLSAAMRASHARRKAQKAEAEAKKLAPPSPGSAVTLTDEIVYLTKEEGFKRLPEHGGEPTDGDMVKADYWMRREAEKAAAVSRAITGFETIVRECEAEFRRLSPGTWSAYCEAKRQIALLS